MAIFDKVTQSASSAMDESAKLAQEQARREAEFKRGAGYGTQGNLWAGSSYHGDKNPYSQGQGGAASELQRRSMYQADNATYGGHQAIYDPETGRMLQDSTAQQEAGYYRNLAEAAQGRQAVQLDNSQANVDRTAFGNQMGQAQQSRDMQLGAYGQQQDVASRYGALASGEGPSLARAMMMQGQNNIAAQQASAAASARGPAGLAMAQQNAAANAANAGQQMAGQMGAIRAQEQLAAMQGYAGAVGGLQNAAAGIRNQDYGAAGLYNQARGMSQQQALSQAQLEANQRALNDQRSGMGETSRQNVYSQQQQGMLQNRALDNGATSISNQADQAAAARTDKYIGAGLSTAGTLGSIAMMSDERNKEGVQDLSGGERFAGGLARAAELAGSSIAGVQAPPDHSKMYLAQKKKTEKVPQSVFEMANAAQGESVSDENSKRKISDLSAALMNKEADKLSLAQAAMYGQDPRMSQLGALQRSQQAMYGAPSPVQETLQNLRPYAFNYKEGIGEDTGQRHVGVMAQDLEKTPAGSTIVRDTSKGKVLDGKGTAMLNLAAAADLQRQMDELKAQQQAMYAAPTAIRGR